MGSEARPLLTAHKPTFLDIDGNGVARVPEAVLDPCFEATCAFPDCREAFGFFADVSDVFFSASVPFLAVRECTDFNDFLCDTGCLLSRGLLLFLFGLILEGVPLRFV